MSDTVAGELVRAAATSCVEGDFGAPLLTLEMTAAP